MAWRHLESSTSRTRCTVGCCRVPRRRQARRARSVIRWFPPSGVIRGILSDQVSLRNGQTARVLKNRDRIDRSPSFARTGRYVFKGRLRSGQYQHFLGASKTARFPRRKPVTSALPWQLAIPGNQQFPTCRVIHPCFILLPLFGSCCRYLVPAAGVHD